ncbi:hypothetical protein O9K51_08040 [Purpureocillium lavendulum]|uniref:Uncharacterized protein n=1 Tax=Purpureocillium lavendulum TaxID=1247861 RepID=A0AB34FN24_9HYPO|nr:hypothetical protein O9K51_08040 [Purpureocillium lavendulum]
MPQVWLSLRRIRSTYPRIYQELPLDAFQEQIAWSSFYQTHGWGIYWRPFLRMAGGERFPAVNRACSLAVVYGHLGHVHRSERLLQRSQALYAATLCEVQRLLGQHSRRELAKLATTSILMGMYNVCPDSLPQVFSCHTNEGNPQFVVEKGTGRTHNVGTAQILQFCGPEVFQDDLLRDVFRSSRALLTCQAFSRQQHTFVQHSLWKSTPWSRSLKTTEDKLMDIVVDLPGLAEIATAPENRTAAEDQARTLSVRLAQWRWEWDRDNAHTMHEAPVVIATGPVIHHDIERAVAIPYGFNSVSQALEILTYNSALLYLMQIQDTLRHSSGSSGDSSGSEHAISRSTYRRPWRTLRRHLLRPDEVATMWDVAVEALKTISYISGQLPVTSQAITFVPISPFGILYWVLRRQSELSNCFDAVLEHLPVFQNARHIFAGYTVSLPDRQEK